jgi:hypothetical protein
MKLIMSAYPAALLDLHLDPFRVFPAGLTANDMFLLCLSGRTATVE